MSQEEKEGRAPPNDSDEVFVRPYKYKQLEDGKRSIFEFYGLNRKSESCLIRIKDFTPFFYFELGPLKDGQQWTEERVNLLSDWFRKVMKDDKPVKTLFVKRKKIYIYRREKLYPFLLLSFQHEKSIQHAINIAKKCHPLRIDGIPSGPDGIQLKPRENKISPLLKIFALQKLRFSSWLKFNCKETDTNTISSQFKHEYEVSWKKLELVPKEICKSWKTSPKVMSFDIETNSDNPNQMPDPGKSSDKVITIAGSVKDFKTGERKKFALTLGRSTAEEGVEKVEYDDEIKLIKGFCKKIKEHDPEVIIGHNIFGYDFGYLLTRLKRLNEAWESCGRFPDREDKEIMRTWESNAYGRNELTYMEMDGRICFDTLPFFKRDYKLDNYRLDTIAKQFLGRGKAPLEIKDMFRLYRIANDTIFPELAATKTPAELLKLVKGNYRLYYQKDIDNAIRLVERISLEGETARKELIEFYEKIKPECLGVITGYCVEDTALPLDLFEKLHIWISLNELSAVVCTEIEDLTTRGQQLRVFSQLYIRAYQEGFVIDDRPNPPDIPYAGGYCFDPEPGLYPDVITQDFNSLYPSEIIAFNIDYSTFVPEGVDIPDSECHILEWHEDVDARERKNNKKKKKKKCQREIIIYEKRRYRFIKSPKGVLPGMLEDVLAARKQVKKEMEEEKDPILLITMNSQQNALKVSANSAYGMYGAKKGKLPFMEGAVCVTAMGRKHIIEASARVEKIYEHLNARVIYGDTDSIMVKVEGVPAVKMVPLGKEMSIKVSEGLPPPLKMAFEKSFAEFFILTAKKYGGLLYKDNGSIDYEKVFNRGIIMSRRDNCRYLKKIFKKIFLMILMRKPLQEILNELVDAVLFLMQRRVPMKDLEIVKKVGNEYKSASNPLAILSTTLKDYGKPVDPGDRIEYVFIESEEKKQGYKLLTPEMVIAKGERIDTAYTMEKQLVNPLDQLLKLGFKDKFEGVTKGKMYLAKFHKDITWKKKMLIQVKEAYVIITKRREMMKKKQMRKIIVT